MNSLQGLIDATTTLQKRAHIECDTHFDTKDYKQIAPNSREDGPRQIITEYYTKDNMFSLQPDTLKQLRTVYKTSNNPDLDIEFAASFFIIELDQSIIAYVEVIKTKDELSGHGKGKQFIADLVAFIQLHLVSNTELKAAFIIVG